MKKTTQRISEEPFQLCETFSRVIISLEVIVNKSLPGGPGEPTGPGFPGIPCGPEIPGNPASPRYDKIISKRRQHQAIKTSWKSQTSIETVIEEVTNFNETGDNAGLEMNRCIKQQ